MEAPEILSSAIIWQEREKKSDQTSRASAQEKQITYAGFQFVWWVRSVVRKEPVFSFSTCTSLVQKAVIEIFNYYTKIQNISYWLDNSRLDFIWSFGLNIRGEMLHTLFNKYLHKNFNKILLFVYF